MSKICFSFNGIVLFFLIWLFEVKLRVMESQIPEHHKRNEVCVTRSRYRQGRKDTAVKVFTIVQESVYLLVQGVPALNLEQELKNVCEQYGEVLQCRPLRDYPREEFMDVFLVQYRQLSSAKFMKKKLDDKTFYGGSLHVCYAPEFETVQDTREKLQWRRRQIETKSNQSDNFKPFRANRGSGDSKQFSRIDAMSSSSIGSSASYIWAGKEYTASSPPIDQSNTVSVVQHTTESVGPKSSLFVPRQVASGAQNVHQPASAKRSNSSSNLSVQSTENMISGSQVDPSTSYDNTISLIRRRLASSTAPNVDVSFKRRKN